jgi:hypothetical protein
MRSSGNGFDRAAVAVALDQVGVPQRSCGIERRREQVADELFERGLVARCRQRDAVQALLDVELRVVLEARGRPSGSPTRRRKRGN